ncbi:DUF7004 family protein [Companilactobacillus mishanensis]|uniref:Uncharacterized protein n=1 Tax=Companilactobacillus mishanensis TaxID=2486008 RepID=A0A5P0ZIA3_9LACO|nr:hypothetical protein [Companilactobacillus mishanensis]MQS52725.1 hypothetical protein [Companilactobacillus mishanensis]
MSYGEDMREVKKYSDGMVYYYTTGKKDPWCLIKFENGHNEPLYDVDFLRKIQNYAKKYGKDVMYNKFLEISNLVDSNAYETNGKPNSKIADLNTIEKLSTAFGQDSLDIEKMFGYFYFTMIAEWYYKIGRKPSYLKHRIKQLGVYQVVKDDMSPQTAATYSKGRHIKELECTMKEDKFDMKIVNDFSIN